MMNSDFLGKGWKYPLALTQNEIACSEGEDLIRESIRVILGTTKGERVMRPEFGCGINELVFAPNNTTAALIEFYVKEALLNWEPRIEVLTVTVTPDSEEPNQLRIDIEYRIKTSNTKGNLVYPFYLESAGG